MEVLLFDISHQFVFNIQDLAPITTQTDMELNAAVGVFA
jgi:hypothetical protein